MFLSVVFSNSTVSAVLITYTSVFDTGWNPELVFQTVVFSNSTVLTVLMPLLGTIFAL